MSSPARMRFERVSKNAELKELRNGSLHLVGDKIYCLGAKGNIFVWRFGDPKWRKIRGVSTIVGRNHAGDFAGDKMYLAGGKRTDCFVEFDLVLEEVSIIESPLAAVVSSVWMTAVFSQRRRDIFFFGGCRKDNYRRRNDVFCFNVDVKRWSEVKMKGELPTPRNGHAVTMTGFDMILYGGFAGNRFLDDLWVAHLKPSAPCYWTKTIINGRDPAGRTGPRLNVLGDYVILFGGFAPGNRDVTKDVELFSARSAEWKCANGALSGTTEDSHDIEYYEADPCDDRVRWSFEKPDSILYVASKGVFCLSLNS